MSGLMIRPSAVTILGASAVAVSCPADTTEDILATINVPAGAMGLNGILRITSNFQYTTSVNNKTFRVRLGGIGGTAYHQSTKTTTTNFAFIIGIQNRGAQNSQTGHPDSNGSQYGVANSNGVITSAIDTSVATTVVITGQKATAGEALTLESYLVELILP